MYLHRTGLEYPVGCCGHTNWLGSSDHLQCVHMQCIFGNAITARVFNRACSSSMGLSPITLVQYPNSYTPVNTPHVKPGMNSGLRPLEPCDHARTLFRMKL